MSRNRDLIEVAVGGAVYIGLVGVIVGFALVFGERHTPIEPSATAKRPTSS